MNSFSSSLSRHTHSVTDDRVRQDEEGVDSDEDVDEVENTADHPAPSTASQKANEAREIWTAVPRPRGRQARDPQAQYIRFDCKDVDDLETNLRDYLAAPTADAGHATIEFFFPVTAAFMVYTRDYKRDASTNWTNPDVTDVMRKTAVSVFEVLQPIDNPKNQIVKQKAVARTIVEAIQRADRFKYTFNNNWVSKEDQAHRFSFFCNESTLNKGRAANGGAGMEGKILRKPAYDCKGFIAVKFSVTRANLQVDYKHVPIHKTFLESIPVPRKDSKRRRMLELLDPDGLKAAIEAAKQKAIEDKQAAGFVRSKTGKRWVRRDRRSSRDDATRDSGDRRVRCDSVDEVINTSDGLQPLIDFLGPAEGATPDGKGTEIDDDLRTEVHAEPSTISSNNLRTINYTPHTASRKKRSAAPAKKKDATPAKKRRSRLRVDGPMWPGMMEGSMEAGAMTWGLSPEREPAVTDNVVSATSARNPQAGNRGEKNKEGESRADADQPETELEALKRRLHETEQRLQRIEAEKGGLPPQPYPPPPQHGLYYPPYGYYPYNLPPYPYPPQSVQNPQAAPSQSGPGEPQVPQASGGVALPSEQSQPSIPSRQIGSTATDVLATQNTTLHQDQVPPEAHSNLAVTVPALSDRHPASHAGSVPSTSTLESNQALAVAPSMNSVATTPTAAVKPSGAVPNLNPVFISRKLNTPSQATKVTIQTQTQQDPCLMGQVNSAPASSSTVAPVMSARTSQSDMKSLFDDALAAMTRTEPDTTQSGPYNTFSMNVIEAGTPTQQKRQSRGPYKTKNNPEGLPGMTKKKKVAGTEDETTNDVSGAGAISQAQSSVPMPNAAPPYPYPHYYPPYPWPAGMPPPPGFPPYPSQGYPVYPPPPPGYPYPPPAVAHPSHPAYTAPPTPSKPPGTAGDKASAPAWTIQLKDAMTTYAVKTSAPVSKAETPSTAVASEQVPDPVQPVDAEATGQSSSADVREGISPPDAANTGDRVRAQESALPNQPEV